MMKKLCVALLSMFTMSVFAQIEVKTDGTVVVGTEATGNELDTIQLVSKGYLHFDFLEPYINWNGNKLNFKSVTSGIPLIAVRGSQNYGARIDIWGVGDSNTPVRINADGNSYFNGGNIGIGTTSPDDLLHVNGFIRSSELRTTGGSLKIAIPSSQSGWARGLKYYSTSAFNTSPLGGMGLYGSNTTLNRMYMTFGSSPWTSTKGIQILPSGNVGVGVVDPATPLFVSGTNNVEGPSIPKVLAVADASDHSETISLGFDAANDAGVIASVDAGSNWLNTVIQPHGGNVGIGTSTPSSKLSIRNGTQGLNVLINKKVEGSWPAIFEDKTVTFQSTGAAAGDIAFASGNSEIMRITEAGNVGIGTTNTFGYKLAVNGSIAANGDILISGTDTYNDNTIIWPDYVFEEDYNLLSLQEVEEHIEKKGHLPNVPSAKEVNDKGGFELGQMNKKLLEKVEELTLYLIDQNKKLEKQEERIKALEKELKKRKK